MSLVQSYECDSCGIVDHANAMIGMNGIPPGWTSVHLIATHETIHLCPRCRVTNIVQCQHDWYKPQGQNKNQASHYTYVWICRKCDAIERQLR